MKHPKPLSPEAEKEFDLMWGIAPPDSLKYNKGQEVKAWIAHKREVWMQEGYMDSLMALSALDPQTVDIHQHILELLDSIREEEEGKEEHPASG